MLILKKIVSTRHGGQVHAVYLRGVKVCYALVLSDNTNTPIYSRLPAGIYALELHSSPHFPISLHIKRVPRRTAMLLHPGNWAGDTRCGLRTSTEGCTLGITSFTVRKGVITGLSSLAATRSLVALFRLGLFTKIKIGN